MAWGTRGRVVRRSPGRYVMPDVLMSNSMCCTTCQWSAAVMRREQVTVDQKGACRHGGGGAAGVSLLDWPAAPCGATGGATGEVPAATAASCLKAPEALHACSKTLESLVGLSASVCGTDVVTE